MAECENISKRATMSAAGHARIVCHRVQVYLKFPSLQSRNKKFWGMGLQLFFKKKKIASHGPDSLAHSQHGYDLVRPCLGQVNPVFLRARFVWLLCNLSHISARSARFIVWPSRNIVHILAGIYRDLQGKLGLFRLFVTCRSSKKH